MVSRKDLDNQINGFLLAVKNGGITISKSYLFGSMAKGNPHQFSDIDIALWSENFTDKYFENIELLAPFKRNFPLIEMHLFLQSETKNNNPFIEEIEQTGIKLI